MWIVFVLIFLIISDESSASGAVEKLSHNIIRNISTYHNFYQSLDDEIVFTDVSNDLIDWKFDGVILKENTVWSTGAPLGDLDINVLGPNKVRLYYTAVSAASGRFAIGVAASPSLNVTSIFSTRKEPLVYDNAHNLKFPTLVSLNNGSWLLTFAYAGNVSRINAVVLNDDGTDLASDIEEIIKPDQDWEDETIQNLWGFHRGDFVYIFYETGTGAVGVARSTQILGPYGKKFLTGEKAPKKFYLKDDLKWGLDGWPVY